MLTEYFGEKIHYLLGTKILGSLLFYTMAFPSSFEDGPQIIDRTLLELNLGLQRFLSTADCSMPGCSRLGATGSDYSRNSCSKTGFSRSNCSNVGYTRSGCSMLEGSQKHSSGIPGSRHISLGIL